MFKPLQKTAYVHAVTCMFLGIASGFIAVVEITITNYVTTRPMSANVMKLAAAGQAMSLVAPVSAAVLIVQIKRRLGRLPEEAVSTVIMLTIVALVAVALNMPPVVQAWHNSTAIALEAWVWIIAYTIAIAVSLPLYAGAVCVFVIPAIGDPSIGEDEKG